MRAILLALLILQSTAPVPDSAAERAFASAVNEDRLRRDVRELVAIGPRMGGTPSGDRASAYLADYFRGLGLQTETFTDPAALAHWEERWRVQLASAAGRGDAEVSLAAHAQQGSPRTVVATLPGREPDKYYLVCAHGDSDSGGPGADDNASGVATVMEMARVLAELTKSGAIPKPRYAIAFAIWGSEYKSTKAYIERQGADLTRLAGVLNFDETGP